LRQNTAEFGEFVEEEDAVVGQGDLARLDPDADG
jgi:hypothetical protein